MLSWKYRQEWGSCSYWFIQEQAIPICSLKITLSNSIFNHIMDFQIFCEINPEYMNISHEYIPLEYFKPDTLLCEQISVWCSYQQRNLTTMIATSYFWTNRNLYFKCYLLPDFQDITYNQFLKLASQLQGHQQIADNRQAVTPGAKPFPPTLKPAYSNAHTIVLLDLSLRKGLKLVPESQFIQRH